VPLSGTEIRMMPIRSFVYSRSYSGNTRCTHASRSHIHSQISLTSPALALDIISALLSFRICSYLSHCLPRSFLSLSSNTTVIFGLLKVPLRYTLSLLYHEANVQSDQYQNPKQCLHQLYDLYLEAITGFQTSQSHPSNYPINSQPPPSDPPPQTQHPKTPIPRIQASNL
jgi:hypothetical protein